MRLVLLDPASVFGTGGSQSAAFDRLPISEPFWKKVVRVSLTLNPGACPILVVTNDRASEFTCGTL